MSIKEKLVEILGMDRVSDAPEVLDNYRTDYSPTSPGTPMCVAYPEESNEIQSILAFANERRIPVIPCSSRVHFFGATIPKQGGIVVDLKRMNRIWDLDERNRKVTIGAGVTWHQLCGQMAETDLMVVPPLLPHRDRSVLTTYLEREVPVISLYEYGEPLTSMEVVWPNGTVFRTGSASAPGFPKSLAEGANPQGPGVMDFYRLLQGSQGTMGIVTWAILKAEYRSPHSRLFFIPFDRIEEAIAPLYAIQRRKIGYECFLMNRLNMALILAENYPDDFEICMKNFPAWTLVLALRGGRRQPEGKLQYEENALKRVCKEFNGLQALRALPGSPHSGALLANLLRMPWPDEKAYWKHRYQGNSRDLFFITKLSRVSEFLPTMERLAGKTNFSVDTVGVYIQPIENARACHVEFNIYYNPEDTANAAAANRLYDEAAKAMLGQGAFFTRPYGPLSDLVYDKATAYTAMLKKVKGIFDPNNILSPGNLCF
ncbi:MAG: FAD-binding oxidoreductase [Pseudomonadota bacterium]